MITETRKERIDDMLVNWGYWCRTDRAEINKATGQITSSSLAQWQKDAVQQMESVDHRRRLQVYPDNVLSMVDSIVMGMPERIRDVVVIRYRLSDRVPVETKAEKLGIPRRTFYNRLEKGYGIFNNKADWGMVC